MNNIAGKSLALNVEASDTVGEVKVMIQKKIRIPPAQQQLVFAAKHLKNGRTLAEYNVCQRSLLHLTPSLLGGMKILVTMPGGMEITLEVNGSDTVADVKAEIERQEGVPAHQQCLTSDGKELEDGRSVLSYNLNANTKLFMTPRRLAKVRMVNLMDGTELG